MTFHKKRPPNLPKIFKIHPKSTMFNWCFTIFHSKATMIWRHLPRSAPPLQTPPPPASWAPPPAPRGARLRGRSASKKTAAGRPPGTLKMLGFYREWSPFIGKMLGFYNGYPLVIQKLWEDPPFLRLVNQPEMIIFNSYVSLPEGIGKWSQMMAEFISG